MKIINLAIDAVAGLIELAYDHPFQSLFFWTGTVILARMAGHHVNGMWLLPLVVPFFSVVDRVAHPRR